MAYVYRFRHYLSNEIIYVGQTSRNMSSRMKEHFGKRGHLPSKCYKSVGKIEYIDIGTKADARLVELYFINKYKPKYNTEGKVDDFQSKKYDLAMKLLIRSRWKVYEIRKKSFVGFRILRISKFFKPNNKENIIDNITKRIIDVIFTVLIYYFILAAIVEVFKVYFQ